MKKQIPAYLLKKYLKGQCTPQEEATIEEWYNSFEGETDYSTTISAIKKRRLKNRIKSLIDHNIAGETVNIKQGRVRYIAYALSGIAASLLIVFLFTHKPVHSPTNGVEFVTITNTTKNISERVLSDGSHVWMMPGAQIKYSKVFSGNKREVSLSGESFFEVTKNPAKPFIIYSGNLITKVWGTSFRVRDSKDLPYADVTVVTGKVSVKLIHPKAFDKHSADNARLADEVMIYPSQQVTYVKKEQLFTEKPKADMKALLIWKKASIAFDNRPLKEVIPVLDKAFDVKISTSDDKLNAYLLNADFNGMNLPQIMEILHKALDVSYTIKGQDVILSHYNNQ